jgi:DNA invertase Pin-like site-specific DNA recombinase
MTRYGYILLDKADPDVGRQAMQLDSIGEFARIFIDRAGSDASQPDDSRFQRKTLISFLQKGDVVFSAALDRWCNNLRDFIETVRQVEQTGSDLCILAENLDTRSSAGRQAVRLLKDFERLEFRYQSGKKKAGIEAARQKGRRIGRPLAAIPPGFRKICREWSEGKISGVDAARQSGLGSTSFYKKAADIGFKPAQRRKETRSSSQKPESGD